MTRRLRRLTPVVFTAAGLLLGCGRQDPNASSRATAKPGESPLPGTTAIRFSDVTRASGIHMTLTCGRAPSTQLLEVKGGGLGLIDFDSDGDLDIFVPNGATLDDPESGPGCRLFQNVGGLEFRDATREAKLTLRRWSFGVAVGDYDGDGFDDIYVACYGPNVLLRNGGDGTFTDATLPAGVGDPRWSTSALFADVDSDGDLDLYVTNYLEFDVKKPPARTTYMGIEVLAGPLGLPPQHDVLYENSGDGKFRDVTRAAGCRKVAAAYGLNAAALDFDGDGLQDIFVANDSRANFLFRNVGEGHFEEVGTSSGLAVNGDGMAQASMGIAVADVDLNGHPDIFTTNFSSDTNTLHLNRDGKVFTDRTRTWGLGAVSMPFLSWGCGFHDLDHDGDEDLLVVNGHVYPEATRRAMDSDYEQRLLCFERQERKFVRLEATGAAWLERSYVGRSAVFGDLDLDGDIDVVFAQVNRPIRVLRNDADSPGHWLIVALRDERPASRNRRGVGSRVELRTAGTQQTRWLRGGGPFQSSSAQQAHFGVGDKSSTATLTVIWPDGFSQRLEGVALDRRVVVKR